ncbi:hypothetical protein [Propionispira raffinosivorans]|uniref:hypothetical protein n=1 Tax=Propionispira raffinosivorans TaxID=86959 RepID=UPI0003A609F0|nr:hypothetical protein [Propionispira raffinosivorans]
METIKNERLQESYIGQKMAENLAIDYDENQLLVKKFFASGNHQRKEVLPDVN